MISLLAYQKDELVAFAALWDQSKLRRVRIHRYAPWLRLLRPSISMLTGVSLPPQGRNIPLTYLSSVACSCDHALALRDLILTALRDLPRDRILVAGFDSRDPLLHAVRDLRKRQEMGQHFLVAYDHRPNIASEMFMVDPGRI